MGNAREVSETSEAVAGLLRERAGHLGLGYTEIARHVGISRSTFHRMMRGEQQFRLEDLFNVTAALGLSLRDLLDEAEQVAPTDGERPTPIPSKIARVRDRNT